MYTELSVGSSHTAKLLVKSNFCVHRPGLHLYTNVIGNLFIVITSFLLKKVHKTAISMG
jgi:hypothetical protein